MTSRRWKLNFVFVLSKGTVFFLLFPYARKTLGSSIFESLFKRPRAWNNQIKSQQSGYTNHVWSATNPRTGSMFKKDTETQGLWLVRRSTSLRWPDCFTKSCLPEKRNRTFLQCAFSGGKLVVADVWIASAASIKARDARGMAVASAEAVETSTTSPLRQGLSISSVKMPLISGRTRKRSYLQCAFSVLPLTTVCAIVVCGNLDIQIISEILTCFWKYC